MRIAILRSALVDLARGRDFYKQQGEGLGDYFEGSIIADIESLHIYAGVHTTVYGCYRMLCNRFPYAIYHEIVGDEIRIRAILGCRRNPKWVRSRIQPGEDKNGMEDST